MAKSPKDDTVSGQDPSRLKKAIDRPIGQPGDTREDAPIGWVFDTDGEPASNQPAEGADAQAGADDDDASLPLEELPVDAGSDSPDPAAGGQDAGTTSSYRGPVPPLGNEPSAVPGPIDLPDGPPLTPGYEMPDRSIGSDSIVVGGSTNGDGDGGGTDGDGDGGDTGGDGDGGDTGGGGDKGPEPPPPVVDGDDAATVVEDSVPSAAGRLAVEGAEGATPIWSVVGPAQGPNGRFEIDSATGQWIYRLDNETVQHLNPGDTLQQIFTVEAVLEPAAGAQGPITVTQTVTITIVGTNDTPIISGVDVGEVTEDGTLSVEGLLVSTDPDAGDSASWSLVGGGAGGYGSFTLGPDGSWAYALDNDVAQGLKAGETATDIFTVRATDTAGAIATQVVTVTVFGTNDVPVISGVTTGAVAEDGARTAAGALAAADADIGDSARWSLVTDSDGAYGTLTLEHDGTWTYTLDNAAAQTLKDGDTAQDFFTVRVTDSAGGHADQLITVTVVGTNDAPAITGTQTGAVTEDGTPKASGRLSVVDVDTGDTATWTLVTGSDGAYGTLTLNADGSWNYVLDNAKAQPLKDGQEAQDIFTVRVTDGTGAFAETAITVTITGANDAPTISGTSSILAVEDEAPTASGSLTVTDVDAGDTVTWAMIGTGEGDYGTFTLDESGNWTFTLDPEKSQALQAGQSVTTTVTVTATDSANAFTTHEIEITVTGTNDEPVISGVVAGQVTEDVSETVSGQLDASDLDVGDSASWSLVTGGDGVYGTLTLDADGKWTYTLHDEAAQGLRKDEIHEEIFTVRVTDGTGATADQTVTVTVVGTNDAPTISGAQIGAVGEDGTQIVSGQFSTSDLDVGDTAIWALVGGGQGDYGVLTLDATDGSWTYTLNNETAQSLREGQTAQHVFTVAVKDSAGATALQTVTITVTGVNDVPRITGVAQGSVGEDGTQTVSGQLSATDADAGDTATWLLPDGGEGAYGTLTLGTDGSWSYALDNDKAQELGLGTTAREIFTVRVTDSAGGVSEQAITVSVTGANDTPTISGANTADVIEDELLTVSGKLDAVDIDIGDVVTWELVSRPTGAYGSLSIDPEGNWTYTLNNELAQHLREGETATKIYTVRASDSSVLRPAEGGQAEMATPVPEAGSQPGSVIETITITITGRNDAPVISGVVTGTVTEDGAQAVSGHLDATDVDVGDTASWSLQNGGVGEYGTLTLGTDGTWTYTLDNDKAQALGKDAQAQETFTVRVTDSEGATDEKIVTVTIDGTNDVPVISGTATGNVEEDGTLVATGALSVSDPDAGDSVTWTAEGGTQGAYGELVLNDDGTWIYTLDNEKAQGLNDGVTVDEIFTVRATDSAGGVDTQTITVTVKGAPDAAHITGVLTGTVAEDGALTAGGHLVAEDPDSGDAPIWSLEGSGEGAYGTLAFDADGNWTYTLDNEKAQGLKTGERAYEYFTISETDSTGVTVTQTITVTVVGADDAPVIAGTIIGEVVEDGVQTASGTLVATDADANDTVTWTLIGGGQGEYGTFTLHDDGSWDYGLDPDLAQGLREGQTWSHIFTVQATDEAGNSDLQTVTITVTGTNDAPLISGSTQKQVAEDGQQVASGIFTASDADLGDTAIWEVVGDTTGNYGTIAFGEDGRWTYTLDNDKVQGLGQGETAQDIFTIRVTDSEGATDEKQVTIYIDGTNDAPVIGGMLTGDVAEDGTLTASGALTVSDIDIGDTAAWSISDGGEGTYGTLVLGEDGRWTYTLDNDKAQGLSANETATETFTVEVSDRTGETGTATITINIAGSNDAPLITGVSAGAVVEDTSPNVSGVLAASDVDAGDTALWSIVGDAQGDYGMLTLFDGVWTYRLDEEASQSLKAGEHVTESFTCG